MEIDWEKRELEVQAYSKLALIYDNVMSHVNYKAWAKFIDSIIKKWHPSTKDILDISCGTGNFLKKLQPFSNYNLSGFDSSFQMVHVARKKLFLKKDPIFTWQGDMVNFSIKKPVDTIVCLYDSINYLIEEEQIKNLLSCCHHHIRNNGLLIFDICTRKNSIDHFDDYYDTNGGKDYEYKRKSKFDKNKNLHSNFFKINFKQSDIIFAENHVQRIYYIYEILQLISHTSFGIIAILDGFSFKNASEDSIRAHFVLRKV